jgi:hypothetical protein
LFDYIKQHLTDEVDANSLTKSVTSILKNTPHFEYLLTFEKYIERLENCVIDGGITLNIL